MQNRVKPETYNSLCINKMGNCATNETFLDDFSVPNTRISDNILLLLKGIQMYFICNNELGMALKLTKVIDLTKDNYMKNNDSRNKIIDDDYKYTEKEQEKLKELMEHELEMCKNAYSVLLKIYTRLYKLRVKPTLCEVERKIRSVEASHKYDINYIRSQYDVNWNKSNFEEVLFNLNFKNLTQEQQDLLKEICTYTTHTFTNKKSRISYSKYVKPKKLSQLGKM